LTLPRHLAAPQRHAHRMSRLVDVDTLDMRAQAHAAAVPLYPTHQCVDDGATAAYRIVEGRTRSVEVTHSKGHGGAQRAWSGSGLGLGSGSGFE
jgi:hypothetical protein